MALDFVAGCVGGAAGVLVGYPLDTVKVKIQTQVPGSGTQYRGTFHCLQHIITQDGARALYKGMTSPLCGVAAINAITFGVYGNALKMFSNQDSITSITLSGSTAGLIQTFIVSPMELVKTQMQVGSSSSSVTGTIRNIIEQAGVRGMFRGMAITFTREVPAFGVYFGSYEIMIREFGENTVTILTAGGVAGILSWLLTYPQDVIKSRLQADSFGSSQHYKGVVDCTMKSVKKEGYQCLTRGLGSSVIRAFPVNAATFYVYTFVMKYLGEDSSVVDDFTTLKDVVKDKVSVCESPPGPSIGALSTIATDMPNIIVVDRRTRPAQWRIYPETMLYACPSQPTDTTLRFLHTNNRNNLNKFNQYHEVSEESLQDIHQVISTPELSSVISITKDSRTPQVLSEDQCASKIKMADFLLPSNLLTNSRFEKIYGFYYLLA